jgi:diguanylate cyclase (GGDEF)-like protein
MDGVLNLSRPAVGALDALAAVAREGSDEAIQRSLAAARELLGMQLAYLAEVTDDELRFHALDGDAAPFGAPAAGTVLPRGGTLCDRMLRSRIGNVIPDVATTPEADAAGSPGVGAYVGVPVRLVDGTVYGSLCCVSDHREPALQERDARVLDVLARFVGDRIGRAAQPESELRALIAVASAVAAAHKLEDVLEVVAEETRRVVGASSVSISRWEREHHRVRTLINVGRLGPDEERFPTGETYALVDYPLAARLLREGESYVISRGDPELGVHDRQLLDALDKGSYIGVPVIFDGRTWGKLEAFATVGAVPFTRRHVPFVEAIAGQVGAAIGRAELFSRVNALAYSDPLTGLGNRRALDERLEGAVERGGKLAIAFCDVDGLKRINDTRGHDAGDRAIRRAADALASAADGHPGASVCRVGGDEFCVLVEGGDATDAAAIAGAAGAALASGDEPVSLSSGAAALRPDWRAGELFRAADAAQYAAKRRGHGRVELAPT